MTWRTVEQWTVNDRSEARPEAKHFGLQVEEAFLIDWEDSLPSRLTVFPTKMLGESVFVVSGEPMVLELS